MASAVAFHHPSSLDHDTGAHPEQPARIAAILGALEEADWAGFEPRESPAADRALVEAVHAPEHVEAVESICRAGGGPLDLDTVCSPGSFDAALHAAGGAVAMVDELMQGSETGPARPALGASLHRPPGHHAVRTRAMGFCLFNNVAIAARHALTPTPTRPGASRVMVLDWDVHHGNGTNDLFHADPDVLFVSIHESPLYPGTGAAGDVGSGAGVGATVNLPVPAGSGDETFRSLVEHVAVPLGRAFRPDLLLVSAGFDAHREDPLAGCAVTDEGYAAMGAAVAALAAELGIGLGFVLEGGYALGALARSVVATLRAATAGEGPPGGLEEHPLALAARERLTPHWPELAV